MYRRTAIDKTLRCRSHSVQERISLFILLRYYCLFYIRACKFTFVLNIPNHDHWLNAFPANEGAVLACVFLPGQCIRTRKVNRDELLTDRFSRGYVAFFSSFRHPCRGTETVCFVLTVMRACSLFFAMNRASQGFPCHRTHSDPVFLLPKTQVNPVQQLCTKNKLTTR